MRPDDLGMICAYGNGKMSEDRGETNVADRVISEGGGLSGRGEQRASDEEIRIEY